VGFFYAPRALRETLERRTALAAGFALDLAGDDASLGSALRARIPLPASSLAFTLRHRDPDSLASAEAERLRLLRGALFALAGGCAAGGALTARVLRRQRRLDALRSRFIAGVSHDLRTPLASILLVTENLESGVGGEEARARYHKALRREAARLRRLIDDVLDFARLERGEAPRLEREELDLAAFAERLAVDLGARVEERGRAFACEHGALPATAVIDAAAVRRALENLVENALKHGTGTVRLGFAARDGHLRIMVADEGPGVPPAERERVFEPFERHPTNGADVGGTGLGLAIVRSIARAHGGAARVVPGAGSTFELELPLGKETAGAREDVA
jgi:two-component system phosphate regulon sensor histidine kinase PhoR